MENRKWIDPLKIPEKDLPLIVLVDDRRSFIGWAIKSHSEGQYNHIMEFHRENYVASQDFRGYRECEINKYLKPSIFLKFWQVKDMNDFQKERWFIEIEEDLGEPWRLRRYDFLGILGQLLHIRKLNNPFIKYCSERVADRLRELFSMDIPSHPTPSELNEYFNTKYSDKVSVYGYWWWD